jgi:hypothetical protein
VDIYMELNVQNSLDVDVNGLPLYLRLHRENYVEEHDSFHVIRAVQQVCRQTDRAAVKRALLEDDWREKIIALYCSIVAGDNALLETLQEKFLASGFRMLKRPILLACAVLGTEVGRRIVQEYFERPQEPDSLHESAAACEAQLLLTGQLSQRIQRRIVEQLESEGLDLNVFETSRQRFRAAVEIWGEVKGASGGAVGGRWGQP